MKTASSCAAAFLLVVAGSASAEGPIAYPEEPALISTKTRAEVQAELHEAQRHGLVSYSEVDRSAGVEAAQPARTRAEVLDELREARRLGLVSYGEVGPVAADTVPAQPAAAADLRAARQ